MSEYNITFQNINNETIRIALEKGESLFILGANGSGKSSLVTSVFMKNPQVAKRISAHRQTWFSSNTLDMTPKSRSQLEQNYKSQDANTNARFTEWNPEQRSQMAIFDLIDADTQLAREIADLLRAGEEDKAKAKAQEPPPIFKINELMRLSNINVEIFIEEKERVMARRGTNPPYSVTALSDGERNAFLIAAAVLTAKPGTLFIIDEPERHLHRAITTPLLSLLFKEREDCGFIVSTHEVGLAVDNHDSKTLLVRNCIYSGANPTQWDADLLENTDQIPEDAKTEILGSRREIIYIEGAASSMDFPIYAILFPNVSIIPKNNCREVENAVVSMRDAELAHWLKCWGIVDNDRRTQNDIEKLQKQGVYALAAYSVESLYYDSKVIEEIAERMALLSGENAKDLANSAIDAGIQKIDDNKQHLLSKIIEKKVRVEYLKYFPDKDTIDSQSKYSVSLEIEDIRLSETTYFENAIRDRDFQTLVTKYPIRESGALDAIVRGLGFTSRKKYEAAVINLLRDPESKSLPHLKSHFSGLIAEMGS